MSAVPVPAVPLGPPSSGTVESRLDEWSPQRVAACPPPLAPFNRAGLLGAVDVHTAATLCRLGEVDDPLVLLAAAFAVRAPRFGHVCADLAVLADTAVADDEAVVDDEEVEWPDPAAWREAVAAAPITGGDGAAGDDPSAPLRLDGTRLYLDRYWTYEQQLVRHLTARAGAAELPAPPAADAAIAAVFDEGRQGQRDAVARALRRRLTVVIGGPGTGKTATVARLVAVLHEVAAAEGDRPPRIALTAPTGKAAARLEEQLRDAAEQLTDRAPGAAAALRDVRTTTIHRLLGSRLGSNRFRHDAGNPLPHDVVVVDECSMVPLSLMARLMDALRVDTRVVLVGDPDQLEAVEAGTVLDDLVGPVRDGSATSHPVAAGVVELVEGHRFAADSGVARFATAVLAGDADAAVEVLRDPTLPDVRLVVPTDPEAGPWSDGLAAVRSAVATAASRAAAAAAAGDAATALDAVLSLRVLCAHRHGPAGVSWWNRAVEGWLREQGVDVYERWYAGRPVLITGNDYRLGVYNGDLGVTVADPDSGRLEVALPQGSGVRRLAPARLGAVETVHALTIHKSQGSQFHRVVVVLPPTPGPILSRQLLYTAVTRASEQVVVVATEEVLRHGIGRKVDRASGLRDALWGSAT